MAKEKKDWSIIIHRSGDHNRYGYRLPGGPFSLREAMDMIDQESKNGEGVFSAEVRRRSFVTKERKSPEQTK